MFVHVIVFKETQSPLFPSPPSVYTCIMAPSLTLPSQMWSNPANNGEMMSKRTASISSSVSMSETPHSSDASYRHSVHDAWSIANTSWHSSPSGGKDWDLDGSPKKKDFSQAVCSLSDQSFACLTNLVCLRRRKTARSGSSMPGTGRQLPPKRLHCRLLTRIWTQSPLLPVFPPTAAAKTTIAPLCVSATA